MITPRSTIRAWMREQIESGRYDETEIEAAAIERFTDDPDVIEALVSSVVKAELIAKPIRDAPGRKSHTRQDLRDQIEADAPASPFAALAKPEPNILLDMASMTKPELESLALTLEKEADSANHSAVFVRTVATQLSGDQRVKDVLTQNDLLSLRGRINLNVKTTVYFNDRHSPSLSSERIRTL